MVDAPRTSSGEQNSKGEGRGPSPDGRPGEGWGGEGGEKRLRPGNQSREEGGFSLEPFRNRRAL